MHDAQSLADSVVGTPVTRGSRPRAYLQQRGISMPPLLRLACRAHSEPRANEQQLIDQIEHMSQLAGFAFPRWLIVNYYVSLKTNPLVILAGAEGTGKAAFTRLVAAGLLGAGSDQFALIPGRTAWHAGTGEGDYFRSLQERFTSLRFLDLLHEAAAPINIGKLYMVCFQRLHPAEVDLYLDGMLKIGADGQRRLAAPDLHTNQQPIIPPNVRISATVDIDTDTTELIKVALRHAGVIDFLTVPAPHKIGFSDSLPSAAPGYQRHWLQSTITEIATARQRLGAILGPDAVQQMTCSLALRQPLWKSGVTISGRILQELTIAVANSFDEYGHGLFDSHNCQRNAQIAYDTHLIQRIRWQVSAAGCPTIASYFADTLPSDIAESHAA